MGSGGHCGHQHPTRLEVLRAAPGPDDRRSTCRSEMRPADVHHQVRVRRRADRHPSRIKPPLSPRSSKTRFQSVVRTFQSPRQRALPSGRLGPPSTARVRLSPRCWAEKVSWCQLPRRCVSGEALTARLATALRARQTIAQATGILMDRQGASQKTTPTASSAICPSGPASPWPSRRPRWCAQPGALSRPSHSSAALAMISPPDLFDLARRDAGLSHGELWLRYFELGGMSNALQVEAFCYGALRPSAHDHDVIAHALNERFRELGRDHPVAYSDDGGSPLDRGGSLN